VAAKNLASDNKKLAMLDLNHPRTKYIFEASALLDEIRGELTALETAKGSAEMIGRTEHICLVLIPKLHALNQEHFENLPAITEGLEALAKATGALNYKQAWEHLVDLEGQPGKDNFGVWAI
jgi:hypothetical protein